jgi:DNA topoisomerase-3
VEGLRNYRSQDGKLMISKVIGGRKISEVEISELLANKRVGPLDGFKSRVGADFSATLTLDESFKIKFIYENSDEERDGFKRLSKEEIDALEVVGKCPVDQADVVVTDGAFICKNYFDKKCKLRIPKTVLGRTIDGGQVQKLLVDQKTDLLDGFRSKRTGKLFSARLRLQKDGKFKFEFK